MNKSSALSENHSKKEADLLGDNNFTVVDGEPVFLIRASDRYSLALIQQWVVLNDRELPNSKIAEALACLEAMREYRRDHGDI